MSAIESQHIVHLELGLRSYKIVIGTNLIDSAGEAISKCLPGARLAIVSDDNVARHHLIPLQHSLERAGIDHTNIVMRPGELTKRWTGLQSIIDAILKARLERGDAVLALGGGVIGDITGFAAAIARRGMQFVQIPTTLLAQVDSSVGGKTGINSNHGKNLIGAFYQPALVLADTNTLDTLPLRDFRAGYAEIVKYGLIDDANFFTWLEQSWKNIFSGGEERAEAIAISCRAKARIVIADEHEHGQRALLNLGHTFAHALEVVTNYDSNRLVHGEAVAIGMILAMRFSAECGLMNKADVERVEGHLKAVGLPTQLSNIPGDPVSIEALMVAIAQDKKVKRGKLTFILMRGIGQAYIEDNIPAHDVSAFLNKIQLGE